MKRLTTDTPGGNFETMLNFVYGKDGWAHIRHNGRRPDVPLTEWAKAQCVQSGCDEAFGETPEEIDQLLCERMMDCPSCPVALAYCFASQAVHLRDRLKMYEDTGLSPEQVRELTVPNNPLTLEELRRMDGEPVWIIPMRGSGGFGTWMLVDEEYELCREAHGEIAVFENCGKTWTAYRRKPVEGTI